LRFRVQGLAFQVQRSGFGFRDQGLHQLSGASEMHSPSRFSENAAREMRNPGVAFGIRDLGFGVWGMGFGVWGLGLRSLGFGVWCLGFGVWC
jgi:hypothetical protein